MSDLLDKYRKVPTEVVAAKATPEIVIADTPVGTQSAALGALAALANIQKSVPVGVITHESVVKPAPASLASLVNTLIPNPEIAAKAKAQEAVLIKAASEEVPAEIFELNPGILEIQGFDAENFSNRLGRMYIALLKDEPQLRSLLELTAKNLKQYEELSYLLNEAQLGLYFDISMHLKGIYIKAKKKKASAVDIMKQVEKEGGLVL